MDNVASNLLDFAGHPFTLRILCFTPRCPVHGSATGHLSVACLDSNAWSTLLAMRIHAERWNTSNALLQWMLCTLQIVNWW